MHTYDIDSDERRTAVVVLAVCSAVIAYLLHLVVALFGEPPWWAVDVPSPFGAFGILYYALDRWGWQDSLLRRLLRVRAPVLRGHWRGKVWSSYDEKERDFDLIVEQTWTRILARGTTAQSRSSSQTASVIVRGGDCILVYTYTNEPAVDAVATMGAHRGTATCYFDPNERALDGDYYTGRGRQTYGTMSLRRLTD